jgi:hypothetical protein
MKQMYPNEPNQNQDSGNPYEFIMSPQAPKQRGVRLPGVKDPFISKLIFIVIGIVIIVIVVGVLISNIFGKSKVNVGDLTVVAQTQQELVRVATQGYTLGTQPVTRKFAITTQLSLRTQQIQILDYLKTQGQKVSTKTLTLKKSATTDTQLTTARQTSTFDSTFVHLMQNSLVSYNTILEQTLSRATGTKEKKILNAEITVANALLQQVPTQESLQNGS